MRKELFLDKVCARLWDLGLEVNKIEKQRAQIDRYLTQIGVGEESEELENEDPIAFADNIFSVLKKKRAEKAEEIKIVTSSENVENIDTEEEMPLIEEKPPSSS